MDRHNAYKLLTDTLERYRAKSFADLESLVGTIHSERVPVGTGEDLLLEISVEWVDQPTGRLRIIARADSPSTFRMARLEESVLVSRGAA